MRRIGGLGLKGADDHRLDPGILDRARRSRSRLVPKTFKLGEAPTALADRVGINTQAGRYDLALFAFSTGQEIRARSAKPCAVRRRDASNVNSRRSTSSSPSGAKLRTIANPPQNRRVRYYRVDLESAELQIQNIGLAAITRAPMS